MTNIFNKNLFVFILLSTTTSSNTFAAQLDSCTQRQISQDIKEFNSPELENFNQSAQELLDGITIFGSQFFSGGFLNCQKSRYTESFLELVLYQKFFHDAEVVLSEKTPSAIQEAIAKLNYRGKASDEGSEIINKLSFSVIDLLRTHESINLYSVEQSGNFGAMSGFILEDSETYEFLILAYGWAE